MEELLEKYKLRLKNLKDNLSFEGEDVSEETVKQYESEIRIIAEICRDLKSLTTKKINSKLTQKEFFSKTQTDNLLRYRFFTTCSYPKVEGDKPDYNNDEGLSWYIDKELLYTELSKRPHRIRAKDRRKKK